VRGVKFLPLVWAMLWRSRVRTTLTMLSIAVAFQLFGLLQSVLVLFDANVRLANAQNLFVTGKNGIGQPMPLAYRAQIAAIPGVTGITPIGPMHAWYQDEKNQLQCVAADPADLAADPRLIVAPDQVESAKRTRNSAVVGRDLAKKYGWKLGDQIVLQPGIPVYGSQDFPFTIRGIYRAGSSAVDNQSMMFHWKYADERSIQKGEIGWIVSQVADPARAVQVARAIDQQFANSPNETKTDTEQAFSAQFASMLGNLNVLLGSVALAVVLTTLFVAGNTMAMSVRERTTEIAVMRTLGFPAATIFMLVVGEGVLVAVVGGAIGGVLARLVINAEALGLAGGFIPAFGVSNSNVGVGLGLSLIIGLLAAVIPATMASRLKIVDALRRVA
jgi:putative ABC transport system permease protein